MRSMNPGRAAAPLAGLRRPLSHAEPFKQSSPTGPQASLPASHTVTDCLNTCNSRRQLLSYILIFDSWVCFCKKLNGFFLPTTIAVYVPIYRVNVMTLMTILCFLTGKKSILHSTCCYSFTDVGYMGPYFTCIIH